MTRRLRRLEPLDPGAVHEVYEAIAEREGSDPLSEDRVYRLLKEQTFLGITESDHTGGGMREGSYLEHRLLRDPEIVMKALGSV